MVVRKHQEVHGLGRVRWPPPPSLCVSFFSQGAEEVPVRKERVDRKWKLHCSPFTHRSRCTRSVSLSEDLVRVFLSLSFAVCLCVCVSVYTPLLRFLSAFSVSALFSFRGILCCERWGLVGRIAALLCSRVSRTRYAVPHITLSHYTPMYSHTNTLTQTYTLTHKHTHTYAHVVRVEGEHEWNP